MITVSSPEYSFITLSETEPLPGDYTEAEICFPVLNLTELVFQIKVITDNIALLDSFLINSPRGMISDHVANFDWYETGNDTYIGRVEWIVEDPAEFKDLRGSDCWTLELVYQNDDDDPIHVDFQNCFQFVDDVRYTSLIQYYNTCPAFSFVYDEIGFFYNQIRLNMFLAFPTIASKRKVYRKSTGDFKRISTINQKNWELKTDYFTERQFMCLVQATEHDFFQAQDERAEWHRLFMPEGETIKPDWQKQTGLNFRMAQCAWSMMEDFNNSIAILCGTECEEATYAYYMEEPIGGDLLIGASVTIHVIGAAENGTTFDIVFPEVGEEELFTFTLRFVFEISDDEDVLIDADPVTMAENMAEVINANIPGFVLASVVDDEGTGVLTITVQEGSIYDGAIGNSIYVQDSSAAFTEEDEIYPLNFTGGSDG